MDLKQFEDNLNNKFKDYEPVVDGMKIWDNIEDQLPQPKKNRRFAWFLILVPILLAGAYFTIDYRDGKEAVTILNDKTSLLGEIENIPSLQNMQTKKENQTKVTVEYTKDLTLDKAIGNSTSNVANTSQLNEEHGSSVSKIVTSLSQNNLVKKSNVKTVSDQNDKEQNTSIYLVESAPNLALEMNKQKIKKSELLPIESAKDTSVKESLNAEDKSTSVIPNAKESEKENKSKYTAGEPDDKESQRLVDAKEDETTLVQQEELLTMVKKDERKKFNSSSSLSTTFTVFGATRNFFKVVADQQGLIDRKNEVEKSLEAIQFGLEYESTINRRLSLVGGLRVWQHTRSSNHEIKNVTEELLETLTEVDYLPDGSIENVYEDVNTIVIEQYNAVRYLRYQSLSALALINYQLLDGNKTSLALGAGFEVGLLASQTGYELSTESTEYLITEDVDGRYKKRSGDYVVLRLRSIVDLSDHWNWSFGLESKYALNGIHTDGLGFNQKFNFLGIQTGFNYTF